MSPTVDAIMSTRPCWRWPRERVEATLELLDHPSSWTELAERVRRAGWPVSLPDTRLTAYRAASPEQRLAGVRHSTRLRVGAVVARWPDATPEVDSLRARLLAWADGGDEAISAIRDDAAEAADGAAYVEAAYAIHAAANHAAAYEAAAEAAEADDAAAYVEGAEAAEAAANAANSYAVRATDVDTNIAWDSLTYICRLLDGVA